MNQTSENGCPFSLQPADKVSRLAEPDRYRVFFVLFAVGVKMYGRRKERKKAITACKIFILHAVPYSFADALNIGKSITLYPLPVARVCQCSDGVQKFSFARRSLFFCRCFGYRKINYPIPIAGSTRLSVL